MNLLRFPALKSRTGLGRTTIYKLIKLKKFPAPVKIGAASGWPEHEVDAAVAALTAQRPAVSNA